MTREIFFDISSTNSKVVLFEKNLESCFWLSEKGVKCAVCSQFFCQNLCWSFLFRTLYSMNSRIFSGFYVFRTSNAPRGIVQHFLEVGLFSNTSPSVFFPPKGEIALASSRSSSHLSFDSFS